MSDVAGGPIVAPMSQAGAPPRPIAPPGRFWTRVGLAASMIATALVIWASHSYLTRSFAEDQNADSTVRATLYAGSIQSTIQRHSVVPLLLARDPILILALKTGQYEGAEERLAAFKEEIGAGSIFLLDTEGRIVAASDERPREQYEGDKAYFALAKVRPRHRLLDHRERRRRLQLPPRPPGDAGRQVPRRRRRHRQPRPQRGGLAPPGRQDRRHRQRRPGAPRLRADLAPPDPDQPPRAPARTARPSAAPSRTPARASARPAYVYIAGTPHLVTEVPVGWRNWRLTYFATLDGVRAQVNAVLSLIIMVLALLLALAFYLLSRRTRAESRRIQRESEELRVLNRRLSSEIAARQRVERNLKEAEQSLEQASKLAALGQMSAAVSHELNQPLAAMKTYLAGARLLLNRRRPEEALTSFQRIDDLIERMGGITRQLKSYARKGDVDVEPVDLRDSVRAALSMMAPQLGRMAVRILTTLPSEPAIVNADPLRLEQIIVNLLRNALDAVREPRRSRDPHPARRGRDHPPADRGQRPGPPRARQALRALLHHEETRRGPRARPRHLRRLRRRARRAPRRPQRPRRGRGLRAPAAAGRGTDTGCRMTTTTAKSRVAIVDDEADMRESVAQWLQLSGFDPVAFEFGRSRAQGARPRLRRRRHQRHPHARHGRHGAAPPPPVDRPGPPGHPDDRPRRRADGGRGDAHRRLRLRREALRPRAPRRPLPGAPPTSAPAPSRPARSAASSPTAPSSSAA